MTILDSENPQKYSRLQIDLLLISKRERVSILVFVSFDSVDNIGSRTKVELNTTLFINNKFHEDKRTNFGKSFSRKCFFL